jgi:serine protease Do
MTPKRLFSVALPLLLVLAALAHAAAPPASDGDRAERRTPVVRAVERAAPSVVNISTQKERLVRPSFGRGLPDIFLREFGDLFRPRRQVTGSLGSGVIINQRGYIVTNAHVVDEADEIVVTLADESQHKATVVSADSDADLAVIRIDAGRPLVAIPMGTSSDLMIGETVIAVGNPYGYQHTVTTGVVSALDRTLEPAPGVKYEGLIQTDAPINPGNSGGPLMNIRGELIAINTAIRAGAQGLGFAIPVDRVREIMIDLLNLRRRGRAWLGLKLRADTAGVVVAEVEKDSPAAQVNLLPGDHIETADGRPATEVVEFETMVLDRKVGDTLTLGVRRADGLITKKVVLTEPPRPDGERLARDRFGLQVQVMSAELAESMRLGVDRGLLVAGVDDAGPAAAAGLRTGDVVVQIDRYPVSDLDTLGSLLVQVRPDDRILFYVLRGRALARVILTAR